MQLDGPTNFGLKNILFIECAYSELQVSFCLVLYMHTHIHKNQEECGQMWSGSTHYALLSGIERIEEGRGKKIKKTKKNKKKMKEGKHKNKNYLRVKKETRHGITQPLFSLGTRALTTIPLWFLKAFFFV